MTARMKIAILDDYQDVATGFADWESLDAEVVVFTRPFADADEVVRWLAGFDVLVAMRERTAFPAEVLARLTSLQLLVSTGPVNAAIDVGAARKLGITVCGTGYSPHPAAEHTWALIFAWARRIAEDAAMMREGRWRNWFSVTIRSDAAERRATVSTRMASTSPTLLFGTPNALPDRAARAALTASTGSDLPSR